jgi:hypothetical protein
MIVRESLGFTRGGDVKAEIGIGREKLIGDFVKEVSNIPQQRHQILDPANKNEVLYKAALMGRADIIKLLLSDPSANPAYRKNAVVAIAAMKGSVEAVDALLKDDRVNPADNHNEALYQAVKNNQLEVVKRLMEDPRVNPADSKESLDRNSNTVLNDNYIILEAASNQYIAIIKELIKDPRVKIKRSIQLVASKLSKVGIMGPQIEAWKPILDFLINHHKAQEELTDKEIIRFKEKINKV